MTKQASRADLELPYLASPLESPELAALEAKRQELRQRVQLAAVESLRAQHLVEVHFGEERSAFKPYVGVVVTLTRARLENGEDVFGGGALTSLYPCPDDHCPQFIHPSLVSPTLGVTVCPRCQRQWPVRDMSCERGFRLTTQNWAFVLARIVLRAELNTDIRVNYTPKNLIKATLLSRERGKLSHGDEVNAVRASLKAVVYPMSRLLTDLSSGAELETCLRAFLEA